MNLIKRSMKMEKENTNKNKNKKDRVNRDKSPILHLYYKIKTIAKVNKGKTLYNNWVYKNN